MANQATNYSKAHSGNAWDVVPTRDMKGRVRAFRDSITITEAYTADTPMPIGAEPLPFGARITEVASASAGGFTSTTANLAWLKADGTVGDTIQALRSPSSAGETRHSVNASTALIANDRADRPGQLCVTFGSAETDNATRTFTIHLMYVID